MAIQPRPKHFLFRDVQSIFAPDKVTGEIGVEIELEGIGFPETMPSYWVGKKEPSLRHGWEYVLRQPATRDTLMAYLKYLNKRLVGVDDIKVKYSHRGSVHVHINCQSMTMLQVYNYLCLYMVLEDLMVQFAGEARVGNLFCLRAKDAENLVDELAKAVSNNETIVFNDVNHIRYGSVNITALSKFGSLEFRALRATLDPELIHQWASMLLAIKDKAIVTPTPLDIVYAFSAQGPKKFVNDILGPDNAEMLIGAKPVDDMLWESIRLVQEIAYAHKWEAPKQDKRLFMSHPVELEGNPLPLGVQQQRPVPRARVGNVAHALNAPMEWRVVDDVEPDRVNQGWADLRGIGPIQLVDEEGERE